MENNKHTDEQTSGGKQSDKPARKPGRQFWRWFILHVERKVHQRHARRESKRCEEKPEDKAARMTATSTAWIAIFTVVLAGVGVLTLIELIEGGADTKALVTASKQQANAASDQADAAQQFSDTAEDINGRISDAVDQLSAAASNAKSGIKATQDAMRLDQRAWVAPMDISGVPVISQPWLIQVRAKNTGKTFAKQFKMVVVVFRAAMPAPNPDFHSRYGFSPQSVSLLPPNGEYTTSTPVTGENSIPHIENPAQSDLDLIKAGQIKFWAFGKMEYTDIFHVPHWTTFCFTLNQKIAWEMCAENNDADDNQPQKPN